jgi:HEAT repeat protein
MSPGERAAVKWKLSKSALLATAAGAIALSPISLAAQQGGGTDPPAIAATQATTSPALYDAVAVLSGTAPGVSQEQRDEAAERLLSRNTPEAKQALHDALLKDDEGGQVAVARALALDPDSDPSFIDPLFRLLENRDGAASAGRALAGYQNDPDVLQRLIERASARRNASEPTRLASISAIGAIPDKGAAAALMQLLENPDESPSIHKAAAAALMNLTGLAQNGEDPARWRKWWRSASATPASQFRRDIQALQAARLGRLEARYDGLVAAAKDLLDKDYYSKSQDERQDLMMTFLRSPEPEVRKIGTNLLKSEVVSGNPVTDAELKQLRHMIADSDPSVRRAVAIAIRSVNDPDALNALLNQLRVEPDPTVGAEIARALGPIHDLRAVPTLIKLLSDDSLETAEAAAGALEDLAQDKLPSDPKLAHDAAEALKNTVLSRSNTPGSDDLRAACINALSPLQQTAIVQELLDHKLLDPEKEDSVEVRAAMLNAVGALNDPNLADLIVNSLQDDQPEIQVQAIKALETNPRAPEFDQNVGALLNSQSQAVRDEAWKFEQGIFPRLSEPQLEQHWVQQLKDTPGRQLIALEDLADKQQAANEQDGLAITRTQIGADYRALKQYDKAAGSYGEALKSYDALPNISNQQAMVQSLISDYESVLLESGKYAQAVALAADRIKRDPSEQSNLGPLIADKVEAMGTPGPNQDLAGARTLIEAASKMVPPLDGKYRDRLKAVADVIQKKTSSLDGSGPLRQSSTADAR